MTFFNIANAGQAQGVGGGMTSFLIMIAVIGLIMYFLMIRPQQKKVKQHQQMLSELKKGDRVITSSGMYGTIFAIQDDQNKVVLKITDEVKVEFAKNSIAAKVQN